MSDRQIEENEHVDSYRHRSANHRDQPRPLSPVALLHKLFLQLSLFYAIYVFWRTTSL